MFKFIRFFLLAFIGDRGVHILDIRLDETGGGIGTGTTTG
jgi:hypothetical protein